MEDFDHENRLHNLQNTLERLLQLHAIPIINENDPVACEEYSLGDNDTLAALVAKCIHADLVVLMSDIDGLYTADPTPTPTQSSSRWSRRSRRKLRCWRAARARPWAPAAC